MKYTLFLDDERFPVLADGETFLIARNFDEFRSTIMVYGIPQKILFDHDLGPGLNGLNCAAWLKNHMAHRKLFFPEGFSYYVHSQNPVGRRNIEAEMHDLVTNLELYHQE